MNQMRSRAWGILIVVAVLSLVSASSAFAQVVNGTISGSVVDSTGGVLPGATVTATETATGVSRNTVTNLDGVFRIEALPVGGYTIKVEMSGFSPINVTLPNPLSGREVRDLGKLTMQLGGLSQTVEVTAAVTPVQTTESSRKATITAEDVKSIQIKGRDIFGLIQIVPGVQDTNLNRDYATRVSATSVTINGTNSYNKDIRVDGMNIIDEGGCGTVTVNVNMDAVQEVQVVSNGYTAENGRSTGGMISLVTKSGTNEFKGSLFYNGRRDKFNSNDFFRIVQNQEKPLYAVNIQGYSFGGPVIIPKVYNSRTAAQKKLFFFVSQEFATNRRPTETERANLPTALERNGDFSQTFITTGSGANAAYSVGPIFDPLTGLQFPGNKIPAYNSSPNCGKTFSCITPLGQAMLNLQKMPNGILNTQAGNLYSSNSAYDNTPEQDRSNSVLRIDSVLTPKTRMSFRVVKDRDYLWSYNSFSPGAGHTYLTSPGLVLSSNVTQVLRPTIVNEMTFGWVHHRFGFMPGAEDSTNDDYDYTQLYAANVLPGQTIPRLRPFGAYSDPPKLSKFGGPQQDQWPYAPIYSASASSRGNLGGYMNNCDCPLPRLNMSARVSFDDSLTIARGRHNYKFGISTELDHKTEPGSANYMGNFAFTDDANNPLRTRNGYASMLIGAYTTYTELTARVDKAVRHWQTDAFAQDSWRISPRFTLDYGLRMQHSGSQYEVNDNHTGFYPGQWNAAQAPRIYRLVCTTANYVNTASCAAANQRTIDPANPAVRLPAAFNGNIVPNSGNVINGVSTEGISGKKEGTYVLFPAISWAPRVGFAWDLTGDGKTALRASTGVFYNFAGSSSAQGFQYAYAGGCPVSCTKQIRWARFEDITAAAQGGGNFVESPTNGVVGGLEVPNGHSYNANVAFQRDIGFNTVAEVAWVGNWLYSPGRNVDQNRLPLYVFGNVANLFNGTTAAVNNLRSVYGKYPGMGSVNEFIPELYNQILNYNAMQLTVTRRLSHGLQMGVAYTYAKGNGYSGYDPYTEEIGGPDLVRAYYYGPTAEDRTHNLVVNYSYNVPTFTDIPVIKQLASDWQISGITKMLSGAGVTPACSSNGTGVNNTRPSLTDGLNTACQLTGIDPALNLTQDQDELAYDAQHFNPAAFAFAAPTDIDPVTGIARKGALGSPGTLRMFRNPTWTEWDLTISRRFGITAFGRGDSGLRLQFQVFNLFNSVQFSRMNATMQFTGPGNTVLNSPNVGKFDQTIPARIMGLTARFDW
jgi:hypothetical protein